MKRRACFHRGGVAPVLSICVLVLCIAAHPPAADADTTFVSGTIHSNTTWTPAGNPYLVIGGTRVDTGVVLTMQPGVRVEFNSGLSLTVDGGLLAVGAETDSIFWVLQGGSISFQDAALDSQCVLAYCEISGGGPVSITKASPTIRNCSLHGNSIFNDHGGAIRVYSGAPVISDNLIWGNMAYGSNFGGCGGGLFLAGSPIVIGNVIRKNYAGRYLVPGGTGGGGIYVAGPYPGDPNHETGSAIIVGNVIDSNEALINGGGIYVEAGAFALITCNTIRDNTCASKHPLDYGTGAGLYVQGRVSLFGNTITGNHMYYGSTGGGSVCAGGIHFTSGDSTVLMSNSIYGNSNLANSVFEIYAGSGSGDMEAESNWWGTSDPNLIDLMLYDFWDDPTLRRISYLPYSGAMNAPPADSFIVLVPNGGEEWEAQVTKDIVWNPFCFTGNVRLEFSSDSGSSWEVIASDLPNRAFFTWTLPLITSKRCLIRVSGADDGVPSDVSDSVFSVVCPDGTDPDGDGICSGSDNCPYFPNPDQTGCPCHGDPLCDSVTNIQDVVATVNVAFRGGAPVVDPLCPHSPGGRTDLNCDGVATVVDVVRMVNVAFRGYDPATQICNPCACNPYPTNCP